MRNTSNLLIECLSNFEFNRYVFLYVSHIRKNVYVRVSTVRARNVAIASTPLLIPLDKDEKVISWQRRTPTKWIGIQI